MAYLKRKRIGHGVYYYIIHSFRSRGKVKDKILEYLGREPDPRRLARALRYWGVQSGSARAERRRRHRG